MAKLLQPNG